MISRGEEILQLGGTLMKLYIVGIKRFAKRSMDVLTFDKLCLVQVSSTRYIKYPEYGVNVIICKDRNLRLQQDQMSRWQNQSVVHFCKLTGSFLDFDSCMASSSFRIKSFGDSGFWCRDRNGEISKWFATTTCHFFNRRRYFWKIYNSDGAVVLRSFVNIVLTEKMQYDIMYMLDPEWDLWNHNELTI